MGRTSTMVPFYTEEITMGRIASASDLAVFLLEGKPLRSFTKGRPASMEQFDDGAYIVRTQDGRFVEFYETRRSK